MKKLTLAQTGEQVSQFCLGAMLMGTHTSPETSHAILDHFIEQGGNFIDTANCYAWWVDQGAGGESETLLGEWMKSRRNRNQIFLATKGGANLRDLRAVKDKNGQIAWDKVPSNYEYLAPNTLRQALEDSLRRLQVDQVDLYYVHIDDRLTPQEETLDILNRFVQEGKVRYIACSNFRTWRLERALNISQQHGWASYVAVQQEYSYLRRKPGPHVGIDVHTDNEQLDFLSANPQVALVAYSPLLKGIYDDPVKRERYYNWSLYDHDDSRARLQALSKLAAELKISNSQLVLAWLLHHQPQVLPIIAASSLEQFKHNLRSLEVQLSPEQMARLNQAGA
jgi:aryl-alcohol dehydrogenase-like predicted oxidoreductase